MRILFALVLIVAVREVPLAGATQDSPTTADARQILSERIEHQAEGRIRLIDFESPSGPTPAPWDTDGERRFLVAYRAEIEFVEPCVWDTAADQDPASFMTLKQGMRSPVPNRIFSILSAGERYMIRGQIALKGTSSGWEPTGFTWSDPPQRVASVRQAADGGTEPSTTNPRFSYPAGALQNQLLKVQFYVPAGERAYYRGTRFDWSGLVYRVDAVGHSFFAEFRKQHDPFNHDDICGTAEEFGINRPAGYDEAAAGGLFLKVGIGLLERPDNGPYNFARRYRIVQEGQWQMTDEPNQVAFQQDFSGSNGWAYSYSKTVEIDSRQAVLRISRVLKNTGARPIETDHYGHNFLKIDDEDAGPDYTLDFPFVLKLGEGSQTRNCVAARDHSLVFLKQVPVGEAVWLRIEGFSSTSDNHIAISNHRTGAKIEIATDQPATRMAFFSQDGVLCVEPFVAVNVPPGATKRWMTTYTFSARK